MLFIFGDSFVDVGGRPPTNDMSPLTRAWRYPYGISSQTSTGRFSDGMVQSDLLAKMLGRDESPPPYRLQTAPVDKSGVNFAVVGSGVFDGKGISLSRQIDQFTSLLDYNIIDKSNISYSVALISISAGHDYYPHMTYDFDSNPDRMRVLSGQVTDRIAATVKRLHDQGLGKVLVNLVPPMGCSPWQSVATNYTSCEGRGNAVANIHNEALRQKLDGTQGVLLLDLYAVFTSELSSLVPCCCSLRPNAYCGEIDGNGRQTYSLCDFRRDYAGDYFFWDQMHPTEYAWERTMQHLVEEIEDFLGIESSW